MLKLINCECGEVVQGKSDEELLTAVQVHISRDHRSWWEIATGRHFEHAVGRLIEYPPSLTSLRNAADQIHTHKHVYSTVNVRSTIDMRVSST